MKILFLSEYFPPETNAAATRVFERARIWVEMGHQVSVITCAPNFPQGVLHAGYRNRWRQEEERDGVRVVRVKTFIHANRGRFRRILDQASFFPLALLSALRADRPDVVIATSPTLFAALAACTAARIRRLPFLLEIGDLASASIGAVGAVRKGMLMRSIEWLEERLYRHATAIVVQTPSMMREVVAAHASSEKISVISNGVDTARFSGLPNRIGHNDSNFTVGYIGTMGMAHGLQHFLLAAQMLQDYPHIQFKLTGDGAERAALESQARNNGLDNVHFSGPLPTDLVPSAWSELDLAFVSLRNEPAFQTVVPSKMFEAMASGVPILLAAPKGEASALVEKHGVGTWIEPENSARLAQVVRQLSEDRTVLHERAQNCRHAVQQYDRRVLAEKYLRVLERVTATESP